MDTPQKAALLVAALAVPAVTLAGDFNYSYVNFTALTATLDTDVGEIETDGYRVQWSHDLGNDYWRLRPALFVRAAYEHSSIDEIGTLKLGSGSGRVDIDTGSVFIGIHDTIMPGLDYFGGIGYRKAYFDEDRATALGAGFFDPQDLESYHLEAGVRYLPFRELELNASLLYTAYDTADFFTDVDDDGGARVGIIFHANEAFGLSLDYERGFDPVLEELSLTLRYKI